MSEAAYMGQMKDIILGREFLTWLWFKSEVDGADFTADDGQPFTLHVENSIEVDGGEGDAKESVKVKGLLAEMQEAKLGLAKGKQVSQMTIRFGMEPDQWTAGVRACDLSMSAFKTPRVDRDRGEDEDPDAAFLEKMYLVEKGISTLDSAYKAFLDIRFTPKWHEECARIRSWITED